MTLEAQAQQLKQDFDEVYDKGYYDALLNWWDNLTLKGKRKGYIGTFQETAIGDVVGLEKLPYPAKPTTQCDRMFREYYGKKLPPKNAIDLTEINKTYDNVNVIHGIFSWWTSDTTEGVIPDYGIPAMNYCDEFAYASSAVKTIELIRSHENTQYNKSFNGTNRLENITFEGVIGQNISFSSSPLTVESVLSIITHLADYAGTSNAGVHTLTLKDTCKTAMAELGAIEEFGGKTYDAYLTDIGWNLA